MPRREHFAGQAFEEMLTIQHGLYRGRGWAEIYHNEIMARWHFDKTRGVKILRALPRSRPDFSGAVLNTPFAIPVYFDAKSTENKKTWRLKGDRLHQYEMLWHLSQVNALCFFLLDLRKRNEFLMIRVSKTFGDFRWHPNLKFDDAPDIGNANPEAHGFRFRTRDGMPDWLSAVTDTWLKDLSQLLRKD